MVFGMLCPVLLIARIICRATLVMCVSVFGDI